MKKIFALILTFAVCLSVLAGFTATAEEAAPEIAEGWLVPDGYEGRVSVKKTDAGIVIEQLVQGTPSNHAVAIAMPVTGRDSYEVTLRIEMEEYVASGRQANDVWTGIGFMGKPEFINWRNNATDGYAKDSPGLFTRFFNYSGEYRLITDVYQGDFNNGSEVVDTWTLLETSAGASVSNDITVKLVLEEHGAEGKWYELYVNGNKLSGGAEFLYVEPEKVFPDNQIYFEIAMNTQKKDTNANTKVTVKSINGVSFVKEAPADTNNGGGEKGGCGSMAGAGSVISLALLCGFGAFVRKRR